MLKTEVFRTFYHPNRNTTATSTDAFAPGIVKMMLDPYHTPQNPPTKLVYMMFFFLFFSFIAISYFVSIKN